MARLILDMEAMQEEFFAESALIGIASALHAYNLCWVLNRHFDTAFVRDPEQNIELIKKGKEYIFPVYIHEVPGCEYKYLLYKLKSGTESLLPETRQLDYLWLVQTANPEEDAQEILAGLQQVNEIQFARLLPAEQLKSLINLLV